MSQKKNNVVAFRFEPFSFATGVAFGIAGWVLHSPKWLVIGFGWEFDVSWISLVLVWVLVGLFFLARSRSKHKRFASNDFDNFVPCASRMFHKGLWLMLGLSLIALIANLSMHDASALALAALAVTFAVCLQWCAWCISLYAKSGTDTN